MKGQCLSADATMAKVHTASSISAPLTVSTVPVEHPQSHKGKDRIELEPGKLESGLAKLVLTVIELLRQLLEKQAIRRMDAGSLTDSEIERMGETFIKLKEKVDELKIVFGLEDEELNLDLGPLGDLM